MTQSSAGGGEREATADDWRAKAAAEREWAKTPIGILFVRFESALGRAWCTDQRESATTASMNRDWGAADKARAELKTAIRDLEARAALAAASEPQP